MGNESGLDLISRWGVRHLSLHVGPRTPLAPGVIVDFYRHIVFRDKVGHLNAFLLVSLLMGGDLNFGGSALVLWNREPRNKTRGRSVMTERKTLRIEIEGQSEEAVIELATYIVKLHLPALVRVRTYREVTDTTDGSSRLVV